MFSSLMTMINEINAFNKVCSLLPREEAEKLKLERRDKAIKDELHRRKLEIAEAGRARNFWGD